MMTLPFNFMCALMMMMSTLMAMSSSNWLFLWASMEINLLSFIPLIMIQSSNKETEAAVKYFLVQAFGSSLMLMSSLSLWFPMAWPYNMMSVLLMISLLMKLGLAPCHLWYPSVMSSMSWLSCFILSTWQKLAPLAILTFILMKSNTSIMLILSAMNALIGGMVGMNQVQLRAIMAYSSITHMGWMIALMSLNKLSAALIYFLIYSLMIYPLFMLFHKFSSSSSMNLNKMISKSSSMKKIVPILLLSLGGLPPLMGFLPKWMAIEMLSPLSPYILIMLIVGAMMNLYFYLNIAFSFMLSPLMSLKPVSISTSTKWHINSLIHVSLTCLAPVILLL